jgi:hypothetical protein
MKNVFTTYQPKVYMNSHYGGGPFFGYRGSHGSVFWTPIRNAIVNYWTANGITINNVAFNDFLPTGGSPSGSGGAVGDAYDTGYIEPFLIETCSRHCYSGQSGWAPAAWPCTGEPVGNPPYQEVVVDQLYPIYKYIFIAVSEATGVAVSNVTCYKCQNTSLIIQNFTGACPEGWNISRPICIEEQDPNPEPGFEVLTFVLSLVIASIVLIRRRRKCN